MKKNLLFITFIFLILSCSKDDRGDLVGVKASKFFPNKPQGMVLIPSGSFVMGPSNPNAYMDQNPTLKTVSLKAFYMDETEISNSEYRQFVNWVRDSVVRDELARAAYEKIGDEFNEEDPLWDYMPIAKLSQSDDEEKTAYQEYLEQNALGFLDIDNKFTYKLNWDAELHWDYEDYVDSNYAAVLEGGSGAETSGFYENLPSPINEKGEAKDYIKTNDSLGGFEGFMVPADKTPNGLRAFKTKRIVYSYREFNIDQNKWSEFKNIEVYPDTTVWYKDFAFSYNEPMHNDYFWHDAYNEYPVVGVSWEQAKAFAHWRTFYKNQNQRKARKNIQLVSEFRLPTEAEWEYAARGGIERAEFPWGGPYTYDEKGCFLANFKPERGDYAADQILYTAEVESYWPNDFGLYNMSGNVAEWTDSNYEKDATDLVAGLNPNVEGSKTNNQKVVRGGSWKDVAHFLKVSTRDYEYQNTKRSYIGFRTVQSYLGEDVGFEQNPNKIF